MTEINITNISKLFERKEISYLEELGGIKSFIQRFDVDPKKGLQGNQVEEHAEEWGKNFIPDPPQDGWCTMFLSSFNDLMLQILLVAAVVSVILASVFPEGGVYSITNYIDTISIFVAVLLVACVQAQTEFAQQKAFNEINSLKNTFKINVIRDGQEIEITNTELVAGDILALKNGDRVPADALYIEGQNLKVDNSSETGESLAVSVDEQFPFIQGNAAIETGDCHAIVIAVGVNSQAGSLMNSIQEMSEEPPLSPLQKKLKFVALLLTFIGMGGAIVTFIILLIYWIIDVKNAPQWDNSFLNTLVKHFMTAVTIFICAVPEGLPLAVTLSLGFSMKKMMNDNNFVRHLQSCETMGGATTICSDKTGTLTQNKMTVVRFYQIGHVQGNEIQTRRIQMIDEVRELFLENCCINSAAICVQDENGKDKYTGSSSECALIVLSAKEGVPYNDLREEFPRVIVHEFNSARKRMSTIIQKQSGYRIYAKGGPDFMIRYCTKYMTPDGNVEELNPDALHQISSTLDDFAKDSLRTMLFAYKELGTEYDENWKDPDNVENDLIVIAIVGINDPLRPEVKDAIASCHLAHVVVRMVTGDYINTAKAIARECGILGPDDIAIEGAEFSKKGKTDLLDILPRMRVMARSSPKDKLRLVTILMEMGEIVAVTGDGSNDSGALKKANVGLSMGLCGTELAKMASDIVILDDNFNSIVSALKWGRCVYDNIRGFLQFQLTVNFSAMLIAIIGSIALHESPLRTIQLLWVNLIMDSFGALALATFGPSPALLNRPPYGESDGILSAVLVRNIIGQCLYQAFILLLILFAADPVFNISNTESNYDRAHISTLVFNTFVFLQVFNLINSRVAGQDMSVMDGLLKNLYFLAIFVVIIIVQVIIGLFLQAAFSTVDLTSFDWLISFGFGIGSLVIGFILRLIHLPDHTTDKLNALRQKKRDKILQKYHGMDPEEQWNVPDDNSSSEEKKPKKAATTRENGLISSESSN